MLDQIVGPFLQSGAGSELLKNLQGQGLTADQASSAVTATAEGAMAQTTATGGGLGGIASLAGGMLGGAGGGLAGLMGGGGASPINAMIAPVAGFVAQKTGLAPQVATMVVSAALPKLLSLLKGDSGATPAEGAADKGGIGGVISGLFS